MIRRGRDGLDGILTPRMIAERLRPDHGPELGVLLSDPRVALTLSPTGRPETPAELNLALHAKVEHWRRHGFGLWLMRDRATGEMVGQGGMQWTSVDAIPKVEVAWAIVPERWGQGLATELARLALDVAFDHLGLEQLVAFTLPHNLASRRVMEKVGFRYEGETVHAGLDHVLYRLARAGR